MDIQHLFENRSAARGWHVIDEIDLVPLVAAHARVERLCQRLERCADGLPELPDGAEVAGLCEALEASACDGCGQADAVLDRLFASHADPFGETLLAHIRARHVTCSVQAQDVLAVLRPHAVERGPCAATLGYMLRCFFDGCRATMAFEELAIRTLADRRLTPAARRLIEDRLHASCGTP